MSKSLTLGRLAEYAAFWAAVYLFFGVWGVVGLGIFALVEGKCLS